MNEALRDIEGLNVLVSDKISIKSCKNKLYLKHLPHVSVIVIFHNEHPSLHAIFNRSPPELIEIILVNDASTKHELEDKFEDYLRQHFNGKLKLLKLKERVGLIVARMKGAKAATSEVLIFLDAHIEGNVNWLPPLLEPIALNPRSCTTPIIDQYNWLTWEYEVHAKNGDSNNARLCFRHYFWDLGSPCSRVAHVFRLHNHFRKLDGVDFVGRNFMRMAETWMDEHTGWKYYLYKTNTQRYKDIDPGDLTKAKAIRAQLNCRPFDNFIYFIAPDILKTISIPKPDDIAYGILKTFLNSTDYCINQ